MSSINGSLQDNAGNNETPSIAGLVQTGPAIDTVAPTIAGIVESPNSGTLGPGGTATITLNASEAVTVTGGPALVLNDGGTATYTGGSGTSALTFSYTVGAHDSSVSALSVSSVSLNGGSLQDLAGNAANLSLSGLVQTGAAIDTIAPTVAGIVESPSSGTLNTGANATLTLTMSEAVTVTGAPKLVLNDGGTATYTGGSGTGALTFSYTVGSSDSNVASLAASSVSLNGGTIKDAAGNAASLSLAGLTQTGPQISVLQPTTVTAHQAVNDVGTPGLYLAVVDQAVAVQNALASLQALATAHELASITLTNPPTPTPTLLLTAAVLVADSTAVGDIVSAFNIKVTSAFTDAQQEASVPLPVLGHVTSWINDPAGLL